MDRESKGFTDNCKYTHFSKYIGTKYFSLFMLNNAPQMLKIVPMSTSAFDLCRILVSLYRFYVFQHRVNEISRYKGTHKKKPFILK